MLNRRTWSTPGGTLPGLCSDILKQPHILIAGATGSGKSILINSLLYALTFSAPSKYKIILIDPKRVELRKWRNIPHCITYASEPPDMVQALTDAVQIMENRYKIMASRDQDKTTQAHIYIFIDEFADLMTTNKRETLPNLCRLAQLGRAAGVHLVVATQRPTRDIINGQIKVNLDCRLALRCPTARDSQNIIERKGAETLPRYGFGYYLTPDGFDLVKIPLTPPEELRQRVKWWENQTKLKYKLFRLNPGA